MKYTVKLYGSLSDDKESFSRRLADALKTDEEHAADLLQRVPVMIMSGASKSQAERLAQDLAAIQALYLLEPEDQELELEEPPRPLIPIPPETPTETEEQENLRHGSWGMGLIVAGIVAVLIVGAVSLSSVYKKVRSEHQPLVTTPSTKKPRPQADTNAAQDDSSLQAARNRISTLESRNEYLGSLIELKREEVKEQTSGHRKDFSLLRRSRRELGELGKELSDNRKEIEQLEHMIRQSAAPTSIKFR